jgi:multimeric flavodoxin WrbA
MKYLIINGSPHKGNTWKLAMLVKENILKEDKFALFDEIHLAEVNLPFCCGCSACFRLGNEKCPHSGTIIKIIEGIDSADGIIFTSTSYNRRETSILKNLFDHLCFMLHRPHFFKSKALVITTTGGVGSKAAAQSISSLLKGIGFNRCYKFSVASFSWNAYEINESTKLKLSGVSHKFCNDVSSGRLHSPSFLTLIPYNLFRGMSLAYVKGTEFETQDGVYWTDDSRKKGVYDNSVKIPFYKKVFGQLFYIIGKYAGRKILVTYKK